MGSKGSGKGHERGFGGTGEVLFLHLDTKMGWVCSLCKKASYTGYVCKYISKDWLENITFN